MGDKIGLGGDSGRVVIPHLEFSILKDGKYIDPLSLISMEGAPHLPATEEIVGKWHYNSMIMVCGNKNIKKKSQQLYGKLMEGMDLKSGREYIEFTEDGDLLFVNGRTGAVEKAEYSYNPEKAELTIDRDGSRYTTYLTITNLGHLAVVTGADHYINVKESVAGKYPDDNPLKILASKHDGLILGATFIR